MSLAPQRGGKRPLIRSRTSTTFSPGRKEKLFLGRRRRPARILFPLPGERVARAARFHQRARVG